ncbi:MAG: hypothetical protein R3F17_16920 [Planctomycetota bacterium]
MIHILQYLAQYEGIESASVVSYDGVLVASAVGTQAGVQQAALSDREAQPIQTLAALASGWLGEVNRAVGPLSWGMPYRYVLRSTQATLVTHVFTDSFLLLVLDPDVDPEETRSLMDEAVGQIVAHIQAGNDAGSGMEQAAYAPQGAYPTQSTTNVGLSMPGGPLSESAGDS